MGKFIEVDFRNRQKISETDAVSPLEKDTVGSNLGGEARLSKLGHSSLPLEEEIILLRVIREIVDKIRKLSVSESVLRRQREIVSEYSYDDLRKWLLDTSEIDWVKKPAFFRAIVDEMMERDIS